MKKATAPLTLRVTLLCGFGLTAGLWLLAGYLVAQSVSQANRTVADSSARYLRAQDLLAAVRAQVLLTSILVRDALLEPSLQRSGQLSEVERAYRAIDEALALYVPVVSDTESEVRLQRLRREIGDYRSTSTDVLAVLPHTKEADTPTLLKLVQPRRESVIALSEELQAMNRLAYVAQRTEAVRVQSDLQRQILTVLSIALAISLVIAGVVYRYSVRLESRLVAQHLREEQTAADLKRLSAHVVKVQEEERRRIARELHDEIGQALTAVNLGLAAAQRRQETLPEQQALLAEARGVIDGALRMVRNLSQLLHPSVLEDLGLSAALRSFLKGFGTRSGLKITLRDEAFTRRLSRDAELAIYRIVQEAVTNTARHAYAGSVEIRLLESNGIVKVTVEDDGVGLSVGDQAQHRGLGVIGMRERVTQLGGMLTVEGHSGLGTRLTVQFPV